MDDELLRYLALWRLLPDGDPIATRSARLLPVRQDGAAAMLKVSSEPGERRAPAMLRWWAGEGAARLLAQDGDGVLLERARGPNALADWARSGRDDEATAVACRVLRRLHAPRPAPPALPPLSAWFGSLEQAAAAQGGLLLRSARCARALLADADDSAIRPLHGDIHYDNILDFAERGWLAIDPKGVLGERAFDYANLFGNPDLADPSRPVATLPGRFAARLAIVVAESGLERDRLLRWILAWAGLSAAWFIEDGEDWTIERAVAELAAAELDR